MTKLSLCLIAALVLAGLVMQLRQQRLDLAYQNNRLHARIKSQQARLWNQQLSIATYTAPRAIIETEGNHNLTLVPSADLPPETHDVLHVALEAPE